MFVFGLLAVSCDEGTPEAGGEETTQPEAGGDETTPDEPAPEPAPEEPAPEAPAPDAEGGEQPAEGSEEAPTEATEEGGH